MIKMKGSATERKTLIFSVLPPPYKLLDGSPGGLGTISVVFHCFKSYSQSLTAKVQKKSDYRKNNPTF